MIGVPLCVSIVIVLFLVNKPIIKKTKLTPIKIAKIISPPKVLQNTPIMKTIRDQNKKSLFISKWQVIF